MSRCEAVKDGHTKAGVASNSVIEKLIPEYAELKKNTVSAEKQLEESEFVTFENPAGKGKRIMFVGNSITRHAPKADIGWTGDWGMAASTKEKDYVHLLMQKVRQNDKDAVFCICQVAVWEHGYRQGSEVHSLYAFARDFKADIIIVRFIENCPSSDFDAELFQKEFKKLLEYLDGKGDAKQILTTGFWGHPGNGTIRQIAKDEALLLVELSDLGRDERMKAIGLFEHSGVANHPGDLGMEKIAERIYDALKEIK